MNKTYKVILFYKFVDIENPEKIKDEQKKLCDILGLKGRILIGEEGINGTLEGTVHEIDSYKKAMSKHPLFSYMTFKESAGTGIAFGKLKVKVRKEIVTLGAGKFDVKNETAKELSAEEFDALYEKNEDFVVLDLRNDFEVEAGYFEKTIDPKLRNFRDLPKKISELESLKKKKVVTVCTGGIRCEKATCLLKREGFEDIYQLKDGIHTYMEKYPGKHFKGTLFVFDDRMVTDVVDTPDKEIVGKCTYCGIKSEKFYNDDNTKPSRKIISCEVCYSMHADELRETVATSIA